ncbi:hypothetical protein [Pedobacter sp. P26]|uniref:hypothetical protein n=1 Tax=Pedobacter sp. P26 TaxID=3423956 RepID=UPI003D67E3A1
MAKGIAGAIANYLIDRGSDSYEEARLNESNDIYVNSNKKDNSNNIGVVAINPR